MSVFKTALMACVMATAKTCLLLFAPLGTAAAQSVPFPPCYNDYRAEIAAGTVSRYYPRCLDDHGIPGRFMSQAPRQDAQPYNCPSGQVFSGGSCVTIQNQGGDFCGLSEQVSYSGGNSGAYSIPWRTVKLCNGATVNGSCPAGYKFAYLSSGSTSGNTSNDDSGYITYTTYQTATCLKL